MNIIVSSDPLAFLRPIYRKLASDRMFHLLAESLQFDRLVEATFQVSQAQAMLMGEYNAIKRAATLRHLANAESLRPGPKRVAMWTLHKGRRVLVCVAVYLR